jgi:protein-tyrosine-phosphatase
LCQGLDGWPQPSVIFNGVREIEIKQKDIPDPWDMYTSSEQQLNLLQSICQSVANFVQRLV